MPLSKSLSMMVERLIRLATGLAFVIIAARYLEPEAFGLVAFSQTVVLMLNSLAGLGMETQLPRMLLRRRNQRNVLLSALLPRIFTGVFAICLLLLVVLALDLPESGTIAIMAPILLFGTFSLYEQVLLAGFRQDRIALIRLSVGLPFFALKCAAIIATGDIRWIAAAIMLESVASFLVTRRFALRLTGPERGPLPRARAVKVLLRRSLPLALAGSTLMLFAYTDQILLRWFRGPAEVGEYVLGIRFTEAWISLVAAFALAMTPAIIRDHDATRGRAGDARMLRFSMEIAVAGSVLYLLLCLALAPWALRALVGDKLEGARAVAQIYCLVAPLAAMRLVSGKWFIAQNLNRALARRAAMGLVINVAVGLVLIPWLGGIGAAISTVIAYIFVGLLADLLHPASRNVVAVKLAAILPRNSLRYVGRWWTQDH
ncbi:MAG: oligosaccharide flippase family protein [Paracoccaceae bacterium]